MNSELIVRSIRPVPAIEERITFLGTNVCYELIHSQSGPVVLCFVTSGAARQIHAGWEGEAATALWAHLCEISMLLQAHPDAYLAQDAG